MKAFLNQLIFIKLTAEMNPLLVFKNKNHETKYLSDLDSYTSRILYAHSILAAVSVVITPIKEHFWFNDEHNKQQRIKNVLIEVLGFFFLLAVAIVMRVTRRRLERFKRATIKILDFFYTAFSLYVIYTFVDFLRYDKRFFSDYSLAWWHFFTCCLVFEPIQRWYLKLLAFLAVMIRLMLMTRPGVSFDDLRNLGDLKLIMCSLVQVAVGVCLVIYMVERHKRGNHLAKELLQEENSSLKQIIELCSDGVLICDMKGDIEYTSRVLQNSRWWKAKSNLFANLTMIQVKPSMLSSIETVNYIYLKYMGLIIHLFRS